MYQYQTFLFLYQIIIIVEDTEPYQPASAQNIATSYSVPNSSTNLHKTSSSTTSSSRKRHKKSLSCISVKKFPHCRQS